MTSRKTKRRSRGESLGYITPQGLCLKCGYFIDRASAITGKGKPVKGDFTVCLNCGGLHMFDANLRLVPTTLEAARDLLEPRKFQALILSQQFISKRGPIDKRKKS